MALHELAGRPAPRSVLANIPRLVSRYYNQKPDVTDRGQRVSFGTSGHRGSSLKSSFNEAHIATISQAICELRASKNITGPLFWASTRTLCPSLHWRQRSRSLPPPASPS